MPRGVYEKIRLLIEEIELVRADTGEQIFLSQSPNKLPPKVDLNPRESFRVVGGKLLTIQIDMDAGKSIHIVQTGNRDKYQFRPVVFVDILTGPFLGKLVLLEGVVDSVNETDQTFQLCRTHPVSRPIEQGRETSDVDDDEGDREDRCVTVVSSFGGENPTSFFDEMGNPTDFDDVDAFDRAAVLGRFAIERDDEDLIFEAEVVQLGMPEAFDGIAETEVDGNDQFLLELEEGQSVFSEDSLIVQLQQGTKVFTRKGAPLEWSEIMIDDAVRATGILVISNVVDDRLNAAFIMVDVAAMETDRIEGIISEAPEAGGARLQVLTDDGVVCVDVPSSARVFEVELDDGAGQGSSMAIDRSELRRGDQVNIFGVDGESNGDCFTAKTVISFGAVEPVPAAAFPSFEGTSSAAASDSDDEEEGSEDGSSGSPANGFQVFDIGSRPSGGLVWVKLPGDE